MLWREQRAFVTFHSIGCLYVKETNINKNNKKYEPISFLEYFTNLTNQYTGYVTLYKSIYYVLPCIVLNQEAASMTLTIYIYIYI